MSSLCERYRSSSESLLAESKILQHQASAGVNDAKEGSKPEPKELEHGAKVIADRTLGCARMLLISKPDRIVARDSLDRSGREAVEFLPGANFRRNA